MTDISITQATSANLDELDAVLGPALHFAGGTMRDFINDIGIEHYRAVWRDGRIVGGLAAAPFGQWFGGACLPTAGISAVGVAPGERRRGVGGMMLRATLHELRAAGIPLAVLYPATLPYYRRAGFARAGSRMTYGLPLAGIDIAGEMAEMMPAGAADEPTFRALYQERARRHSGHLERPNWLWRYRFAPPQKRMFHFLAMRDGKPEGYLAYYQGERHEPLTITDVCVLTPAAGRAILGVLDSYRSMVDEAIWNGGPLDPLLYLLDDHLVAGARLKWRVARHYDWMLRLVDVAQALTARGYPPDVSLETQLQIDDDVLPENHGCWTLRIHQGRAEVESGGAGRVRLDIRDLTALYTGFLSPIDLLALGAVSGAERDLAALTAAFAAPRPWMPDIF